MIKKLLEILQYPAWYLQARNRHGIHSPFLYDFLDKCLYASTSKELFKDIEKERTRMGRDHEILTYPDPGAGSKNGFCPRQKHNTGRSVANIASKSLKPAHYGRLFYRMIRYFNYTRVLEMGTSLGITTSYLARSGKHVKVFTIEAADPVADKASEVFNNLGLKNISLIRGTFEEQLPHLWQNENAFDMVFLDGDHKGDKVLKYFNDLVKHIPERGVVIIDDIRWSASMKKAWDLIIKHPKVTISLDMYFTGIVIFNPDLTREHFKIRFP